jgi:hypothetical protein
MNNFIIHAKYAHVESNHHILAISAKHDGLFLSCTLSNVSTPGGEKLKLQCFDIGKNSILVKGLGDQLVTNIEVYPYSKTLQMTALKVTNLAK